MYICNYVYFRLLRWTWCCRQKEIIGAPYLQTTTPYTGARARGWGRAAAPQTRAKPLFFGQKLNFFGQKPTAKNEKEIFFCIYQTKKRNSFHLARYLNCPRNPGFLLIITGWGESGKVILQVSIVVFSGAAKKFFGQRWLSPPRKNWPVRLWLRAWV